MPRYKALFLTGIFAFAVSVVPLSRAQAQDDVDSQARIVRISNVVGQVRLDTGHGYENVTMNVPIAEGDWLQTRSDGWAEVELEDGSTIRLAPDTQIIFAQLARFSSGGTATTVDLDQGEAEFKITKRDESEFQVTVKKKTIILDQSGRFRVTSTNADPLEIGVWKGSVGVKDPDSGGEIDVRKNETFLLDAQDLSRYALDKGAEADDLDQWSQQRDDDLSTYAASSGRYAQSPYQAGASDLDQYGQYTDVPGYGSVWQPNDVGLDWNPYENGYWSYSPAFGTYWVSSYPWGWMPFRYGNWVFVHGRGWCWQSGQTGHTGGWTKWHRSPRLVNPPAGFRPPVAPVRRAGPGGQDDIHRQPPRPVAPGRIDGDHGHNTINGGGAGVVPQNPDHRPVAPGRAAGDHGYNNLNGGGGDVAPRQNPDQTRPRAPGRIDGDHGHNTMNGGDPQNTDPQGGGGGRRRVFNNDNTPTTTPAASAPPAPTTAQPGSGFTPKERPPKVIERGNGVMRSESGVDGSHQGGGLPAPVVTRPVETQVERTRFSGSPAQGSQPVRQYTPPAQTPAPPQPAQSQPVRQYTPPPVQHTPPPPPPPVQQAPPRQFTPPAPQPRPAPPATTPKQDGDARGRQR